MQVASKSYLSTVFHLHIFIYIDPSRQCDVMDQCIWSITYIGYDVSTDDWIHHIQCM